MTEDKSRRTMKNQNSRERLYCLILYQLNYSPLTTKELLEKSKKHYTKENGCIGVSDIRNHGKLSVLLHEMFRLGLISKINPKSKYHKGFWSVSEKILETDFMYDGDISIIDMFNSNLINKFYLIEIFKRKLKKPTFDTPELQRSYERFMDSMKSLSLSEKKRLCKELFESKDDGSIRLV